jgi:hypothetical protein
MEYPVRKSQEEIDIEISGLREILPLVRTPTWLPDSSGPERVRGAIDTQILVLERNLEITDIHNLPGWYSSLDTWNKHAANLAGMWRNNEAAQGLVEYWQFAIDVN